MTTTETQFGQSRNYRFGPLEKKGVIAGLRAGQIVIIGLAVLFAIIGVALLPMTIGLFFVFILFAFGASVVFMEPMGRGVDEWIPIVWRWNALRLRGKRTWLSKSHLLGISTRAGMTATKTPALPDALSGLSIIEVPLDDTSARVGILKDSGQGLFTGVLAVRGNAFALLDQAEKERRLSSWGDVLAGIARPGSVIHRIQWIERALPDDGDALNRYLQESGKEDDDSAFHRSYVELLEEYGPQNQQHEVYIAVQISAAKKAARAIRKAGGGDEGAAQVLVRELKYMAYRLNEADIKVEGALTPRLLSRLFRTQVDPSSSRLIARRGRNNPGDAGVAPENAWPLSTHTTWSTYHTEDAIHATYWISEWPRNDVSTDFLAPLMLRSSRMRSVSLVMQPVDLSRAVRETQNRHTSYLADDELRGRAGYMQTKRRQNELESIERRESELASGFVEFRMSGYITVTAFSEGELEEACAEVEQAAQQSRLELRRLHGEQDWAFTCTLPTCRGVRE